jgi:hypothetical protein
MQELTHHEKSKWAEAEELLLITRVKEVEAEKKLLAVIAKKEELLEAGKKLFISKQLLVAAESELEVVNNKIQDSKAVLNECQKQVKNVKDVIRYHRNKWKDKSSSNDDDVLHLVKVIEGALWHLKGKHISTNARLLMEAVVSGQLFNTAAATLFQEKIREYIRGLFQPWKLVKAADVAAVGAFKSSTINALREVVDERMRICSHLSVRLAMGGAC